MVLSFVPLDGALVPVPGDLTVDNQQPRRMCARVRGGAWQTTATPHTVESTDKLASGLIRMAQRGDIAPADAATAAEIGLPFRPVEYRDGAWRIAQITQTRRGSAPKEL